MKCREGNNVLTDRCAANVIMLMMMMKKKERRGFGRREVTIDEGVV